MRRPKNKYRKGPIIFGLDELVGYLKAGRWVYLRDKPKHPCFIISMTLRTIVGFLDRRDLAEAIDQHKEYYTKLRDECRRNRKVSHV